MDCSLLNIVVCTADNRYSREGYWNLTDKANSLYCKKWSYDYKRVNLDGIPNKHKFPSWLKIQVVRDCVQSEKAYDIVVWLDSDVLMQQHEVSLEEFLTKHKGHAQYRDSIIVDFISDGDKSSKACAGIFFLWAKHPRALELLDSWDTYEYKGLDVLEQAWQSILHRISGQYEQRILQCRYWPFKAFMNIVQAPSFIQRSPNQFFFHCANYYKEQRYSALKEAYDKIFPTK